MKVAFIVGSFVTPYQGGSPSAYSVKERINQTHETLKSIRERCPEAKIYFVEGSDTSIEDYGFDYDELIRPSSDFEARKLLYSTSKSPGECVMMIYAATHIPLEEYDLVFKISGRYTLTEDFSLDNFSREKFTFYDHTQWGYETTLYAFPGSLKNVWIEILQKSLNHMSRNHIDSIEITIRFWLNVKYVHGVDKLGIQGFNAPMRRFIRY
jgi:hypothetical protein